MSADPKITDADWRQLGRDLRRASPELFNATLALGELAAAQPTPGPSDVVADLLARLAEAGRVLAHRDPVLLALQVDAVEALIGGGQ